MPGCDCEHREKKAVILPFTSVNYKHCMLQPEMIILGNRALIHALALPEQALQPFGGKTF